MSPNGWKGFLIHLLEKTAPARTGRTESLRRMFLRLRKDRERDRREKRKDRWNRFVSCLSWALKKNLTRDFLAVGAPVDPARVKKMLGRR